MLALGLSDDGSGQTFSRSDDSGSLFVSYMNQGEYLVLSFYCGTSSAATDALIGSIASKATSMTVSLPGKVTYQLPVNEARLTGYTEVSFSLATGALTNTLVLLRPKRISSRVNPTPLSPR
jgi:hypothetical protein